MQTPQIPKEILSLFVDYVDPCESNGMQTLSRLALAHSSLLTIVRKRRSSEIVVSHTQHKRPVPRHLQRLSSIVRSDPSFGALVTSLTLEDHATRGLGGASYGWLMNSEATDVLPGILETLTSLKCLTLKNGVTDIFIDWKYIDIAVQDALFDLFSSRTLHTLSLGAIINMELTPLIDCSNLRELSLKSVSLDDSDLEPVEDLEPDSGDLELEKGQLDFLEVSDCGVALAKLVEGFARDDARLCVTSLRRLKVHASLYDDEMESALRKLLEQSGSSFEEISFRIHLDFNCSRSEQRVMNCLKFRDLPLVRLLEIEVAVNLLHCQPLPQAHIDCILDACHRMSKHNLQVVRIHFAIQPLGPYPFLSTDASTLSKSLLDNDLWPALDSLPAKVLDRLKVIEIVVRGEEWMATSRSSELVNLVQNFKRTMPNLTQNGIIHVCWAQEDGA